MENFSNSSELLYCSNCQVNFKSDGEYKLHYKTEFHRYNIKRKLLELPPITLQQYERQFQESQKSDATSQNGIYRCEPCQSKKHKQNEESQQISQKIISQSDISQSIDHCKSTLDSVLICLFCDKQSETLKENLNHMKHTHGFFICEESFLVDKEGLFQCLAEKINKQFKCLHCEFKISKEFKSGEAVKKHMIDKGHCFMSDDQFEDYVDYYDFTIKKPKKINDSSLSQQKIIELSSEEDAEDEKQQEQQQNSNNATDNNQQNANNDGIDIDDNWEYIIDYDSDNQNDKQQKNKKYQSYTNNYQQKKGKSFDQKDSDQYIYQQEEEDQQKEEDQAYSKLSEQEKIRLKKQAMLISLRLKRLDLNKATFSSIGELILPNGKILGHRQYRHYYQIYYRKTESLEDQIKLLDNDNSNESPNIQNNFNARIRDIIQNQQNLIQQELMSDDQVEQERSNRDKLVKRLNYLQLKLQLKNRQPHFRNQNPN